MNIYTKGGDRGTTSLIHTKNISKSDDRIQLVGTIDELTSHLGLIKNLLRESASAGQKEREAVSILEEVQSMLITVMAGVADPYKKDYRIGDTLTEKLEKEIEKTDFLYCRDSGDNQIYRNNQNASHCNKTEQQKYPLNSAFK